MRAAAAETLLRAEDTELRVLAETVAIVLLPPPPPPPPPSPSLLLLLLSLLPSPRGQGRKVTFGGSTLQAWSDPTKRHQPLGAGALPTYWHTLLAQLSYTVTMVLSPSHESWQEGKCTSTLFTGKISTVQHNLN